MYGVMYRRPRWPWTRVFWLTGMAGLSGQAIGFVMELNAHRKFLGSLDDNDGWFRALHKVHERQGGREALGWSFKVPERPVMGRKPRTEQDMLSDIAEPEPHNQLQQDHCESTSHRPDVCR